jgi:cobalt-zinc-cadmium resistance protein CzcA
MSPWRPFGGTLALLLTGTFFSVSSGVGFLALFGVSVQTGVIMLEYINQLRARGYTPEGARRGRCPAASPHHDDHAGGYLGTASRRHVARHRLRLAAAHLPLSSWEGLIDLLMSIFLLPTLYVWVAREGDKLPKPEASLKPSKLVSFIHANASAVMFCALAFAALGGSGARSRRSHGTRSRPSSRRPILR